jgi:hypothetical protein
MTGVQSEHENEKTKMTWSSPTKWTLLVMSPRGYDSNVSVDCDHSERVPGIHMRISQSITLEFSSSRTMNELNGEYGDKQKRKEPLLVASLSLLHSPQKLIRITFAHSRVQLSWFASRTSPGLSYMTDQRPGHSCSSGFCNTSTNILCSTLPFSAIQSMRVLCAQRIQ